MIFARMRAGDESVQPLDPVDKPVLGQELQSAVCDRRLRRHAVISQHIEDFVGPHRSVLFQQDFKDAPPRRCQLYTGILAMGRCGGQAILNAMRMIVSVETYRIHGSTAIRSIAY